MKCPRHWLSYVCESVIEAGELPSWEAAPYFCDRLFSERPNPSILQAERPYEASQTLLQRLYRPIVEAASREVEIPSSAMLHIFIDVSLTGKSAVLVVYFPGQNRPHRLLMLDAVKTWDLVFDNTMVFNEWAEERAKWVAEGLRSAVASSQTDLLDRTISYRLAPLSGS
ncbi:MAG: hypothetical protein NW703_13000 [Nitrospiraceae bacterium]